MAHALLLKTMTLTNLPFRALQTTFVSIPAVACVWILVITVGFQSSTHTTVTAVEIRLVAYLPTLATTGNNSSNTQTDLPKQRATRNNIIVV
jgi:hypothetical protein